MTWWTSLVRNGREGLRVERALADRTALARAAVALVVAVVLGEALGDPTTAAMLSVGAFLCGIGTLLSPLRHHAVNAAAMAGALAALAAVGALVHQPSWLFLLVLVLAAGGAGIWRALGRAPGIRACLCVIGLLITGDLAPDLLAGLLMTGWIAAGAGLVVLAQLLPPYGSRYPAQRQALAALYDALASSAGETGAAGQSAVGQSSADQSSAGQFAAARRALEVLPQQARPAAAALYGLLGEAEGLRRALDAARHHDGAPAPALHCALTGIARTVRSGRPHEITERTWQRLDSWVRRCAAQSPRTLVTRLREADRLARMSTEDDVGRTTWPHAEVPGMRTATGPLRRTGRRLLTELTPRSPVFRHSLRMAGGVLVGELVGRTVGGWGGLGLPAHGFWVALTTMLVLFPDYGSTISRGWGRATGAVLGGLLAAALAQVSWSALGLAAMSAVLGVAAFLTLRTGQMALNLWLTAWVVFLVQRVGGLPLPTAWARAADTVVGAALAMFLFLVWPTWSARRLLDHLAEWLRLLDRLLPDLVTGYADVGAADPAEVDRVRARARAEREQLEAAVHRAEAEPARHRSPWTGAQLRQVQTRIHRLARHTAALHEHLPTTAEQTVPELAELSELLHRHLAELARSAAGAQAVAPGALRTAFDEFTERTGLGAGDPGGDPRARAVALCSGVVDGIEDLVRTLANQPVPPGQRAGEQRPEDGNSAGGSTSGNAPGGATAYQTST